MNTIIEPFRIKTVEPIRLTSPEEREAILRKADFNLFRVPADGGPTQRLTDKPGNHSPRFNKQFTHFFDYYSQSGQPIRVDLRDAAGMVPTDECGRHGGTR